MPWTSMVGDTGNGHRRTGMEDSQRDMVDKVDLGKQEKCIFHPVKSLKQ